MRGICLDDKLEIILMRQTCKSERLFFVLPTFLVDRYFCGLPGREVEFMRFLNVNLQHIVSEVTDRFNFHIILFYGTFYFFRTFGIELFFFGGKLVEQSQKLS